MKLLLVEDEPELARSIATFLEQVGFRVEQVSGYGQAMEKLALYNYECLLVDLGLPDGDGLDIIRALRQQDASTGILVISAKNALDDRIDGLNLGADDYLPKPFHLAELNARVQAILRRRQFGGKAEIRFAEISVHTAERRVFAGKRALELTRKEYDLLLFFLANKYRVVTREAIAEHLLGDDADQMDDFNFIYSHVKNLRKKLAAGGAGDYIQAVYGIGYKFTDQT